MAWGHMDFDPVYSFEEAERKYYKTKPIRGSNDVRPLGERRKKHHRITKIDDDTFACTLYHTDVVTYYRDGRVLISLGNWDTQTTRDFLHRCMPLGYNNFRANNRTHIYNTRTPEFRYILGNTAMLINTNTGEITGYAIPTKSVANRVASKAKREQFKEFLQIAKGTMEVLQIQIPQPKRYGSGSTVFNFLRDPTQFGPDDYMEVLSCFVHSKWFPLTYKQIEDKIKRASTVYNEIALPIGSMQGRIRGV
jgi:hypothetical protein